MMQILRYHPRVICLCCILNYSYYNYSTTKKTWTHPSIWAALSSRNTEITQYQC